MRKLFSALGLALSVLLANGLGLIIASVAESASGEVNLYSYRQPFLIKSIVDAFTRQTGIRVNIAYVRKGMLEKIRMSPGAVDAVLTSDVGSLNDMGEAGLLQSVKSEILERNVPPQFRHPGGRWFGLTVRGRVIFASKDRVAPGEVATYEDLAHPRLRGRLCMRSGKHVYNVSLIASIIAHKGEAAAREWLRGMSANLARKPGGNDRAQAKAIYSGQCDVAVGNTYYMGKMATNDKKPEQKKWAAAIRLVFPNQDGRGTHVNISGGAVTRGARNREGAIRLLEFLSDDVAQKLYAEQNFEYPVKPGVEVHRRVKSWGAFEADAISLSAVAEYRAAASRLVDQVDFNNYRERKNN